MLSLVLDEIGVVGARSPVVFFVDEENGAAEEDAICWIGEKLEGVVLRVVLDGGLDGKCNRMRAIGAVDERQGEVVFHAVVAVGEVGGVAVALADGGALDLAGAEGVVF